MKARIISSRARRGVNALISIFSKLTDSGLNKELIVD